MPNIMIMAKTLNHLMLAVRAIGQRHSFHKTQEIKMILVIVKKLRVTESVWRKVLNWKLQILCRLKALGARFDADLWPH